MDRLEIINYFVNKHNYKRYLEIGVFTGYTLDGCRCETKIGVDPQPGHYRGKWPVVGLTSDAFFATLDPSITFDIVFIDGHHTAEQMLRDAKNALKCLSPRGTIIFHDCNPSVEVMTTTGTEMGEWTGDVYKGAIQMRMAFPYSFYVMDVDYGVGVLEMKDPGQYAIFESYLNKPADITWSSFNLGRSQLLNLKSQLDEEFINSMLSTLGSTVLMDDKSVSNEPEKVRAIE